MTRRSIPAVPFVCSRYTRGYLIICFMASRSGARLLAIHNVTHYQTLMSRMRQAILDGNLHVRCDP